MLWVGWRVANQDCVRFGQAQLCCGVYSRVWGLHVRGMCPVISGALAVSPIVLGTGWCVYVVGWGDLLWRIL